MNRKHEWFMLLICGTLALASVQLKITAERLHRYEATAVVGQCKKLWYTGGADARVDRPHNLRAASSITWTKHNQLVLVQDDVNFIGFVDFDLNQDGTLRDEHMDLKSIYSVSLPATNGSRQFDYLRQNKMLKLDLEASIYLVQEQLVVAFGSGSAPGRDILVLYHDEVPRDHHAIDPEEISVLPAFRLYNALRENKDFSGASLNIEGAAILWTPIEGVPTQAVRLFQRGNGLKNGGHDPVSSTADLDLEEFLAFIKDPRVAPVPRIHNVIQYDLGHLKGVPLSFTDATVAPLPPHAEEGDSWVFYLAGAESTEDVVQDGPVTGNVLGVMICPAHKPCVAYHVPIRSFTGELFHGKAEGIVLQKSPTGEPELHSALIVLDRDDPLTPCEMCLLELKGFSFDM